MLRWFVGGAILGPLVLVLLGSFISNPRVLMWVALVVAAPFAIAIVRGIGDRARWRREAADREAQRLRDAEAWPRIVDGKGQPAPAPPGDGRRTVTPEDVRLRRDYRGWRFVSPRNWPGNARPD